MKEFPRLDKKKILSALALVMLASSALPAHATTDTVNITFTATVESVIDIICTSDTDSDQDDTLGVGFVVTETPGLAPTAPDETISCTLDSNDSDDDVDIDFSGGGSFDGTDEVTIDANGGADSLTVKLQNQSGFDSGTWPSFQKDNTTGTQGNFSFDASITDFATTTHSGTYTNAAALVLTGTSN